MHGEFPEIELLGEDKNQQACKMALTKVDCRYQNCDSEEAEPREEDVYVEVNETEPLEENQEIELLEEDENQQACKMALTKVDRRYQNCDWEQAETLEETAQGKSDAKDGADESSATTDWAQDDSFASVTDRANPPLVSRASGTRGCVTPCPLSRASGTRGRATPCPLSSAGRCEATNVLAVSCEDSAQVPGPSMDAAIESEWQYQDHDKPYESYKEPYKSYKEPSTGTTGTVYGSPATTTWNTRPVRRSSSISAERCRAVPVLRTSEYGAQSL